MSIAVNYNQYNVSSYPMAVGLDEVSGFILGVQSVVNGALGGGRQWLVAMHAFPMRHATLRGPPLSHAG